MGKPSKLSSKINRPITRASVVLDNRIAANVSRRFICVYIKRLYRCTKEHVDRVYRRYCALDASIVIVLCLGNAISLSDNRFARVLCVAVCRLPDFRRPKAIFNCELFAQTRLAPDFRGGRAYISDAVRKPMNYIRGVASSA